MSSPAASLWSRAVHLCLLLAYAHALSEPALAPVQRIDLSRDGSSGPASVAMSIPTDDAVIEMLISQAQRDGEIARASHMPSVTVSTCETTL